VTLDNVIKPFSDILSQDKKLMMELIEVRMLLETEIAKMAARKINETKTKEIEDTLELMKKEVDEGGIGLEGDNAFHNSLAKAAGNTAMRKILNMCGDLLSSNREATLKIPGQPRKSIDDHRKIFEAVREGNGKKAGALMKGHLLKAYKNLQEY
jgi:GntR family transcriptional regulator, transcriptional repressor for pyruvate dehydrogenase complex